MAVLCSRSNAAALATPRVRFAYPGYASFLALFLPVGQRHRPRESRITNHESPLNNATNACAARESVRPPWTT